MNSAEGNLNGVDRAALKETIEAVRQQPELAQVTFNASSEWIDGCHQVAKTGDVIQNGDVVESRQTTYEFASDEPVALLGTDKAASPGEYLLQALAGCYAVTFAANAAAKGIELSRLSFDLSTDFDLQGFLGVDTSVRSGAQEIRVQVRAESPNASDEQLAELVKVVEARSPIRDTLAAGTVVRTELA